MAPPEYTFKCLRRGHCCTNLHTNTDPVRGLGLKPDEIKLFSKKHILPDWGVVKHPEHKDFRIIMYQLSEDRCPHYTDEGCTIYDNRPLNCRAYPVTILPVPQLRMIMIEPESNCTWSKQIREKYTGRPPADIIARDPEGFRAAFEVHDLELKFAILYRGLQSWTLDVVKRQWVKSIKEEATLDKRLKFLIKDANKAKQNHAEHFK